MKSVVITGGNKGLGIDQTRYFLSRGWQVYVVSRTEAELASIKDSNLAFVAVDLAKWLDVSWLDEIHAKTGTIDAIVNNAGMHLKKPVWEVAPDEFERVLAVNLKAMFSISGRYVSLQREIGGSIVNISSMGGIMALESAAAYVTSKTAVVGLTRSVAVDAAPFGIRCNAVCPGFIDTDMTRAILEKDPERRRKIEGRIPSHKFGTPGDVARAVHYLASDESAYINGVALPVDGGYAIGF